MGHTDAVNHFAVSEQVSAEPNNTVAAAIDLGP